jgi:hypothetical protein
MMNMLLETNVRRIARHGATAMLVLAAGCNPSDSLLSANDPDIVKPVDVQTADGADAVRLGAMARFRNITAGDNGNGNESTWLFGGLLTDEWGTSSTFVQNDEVDERSTKLDNSTVTYAFRKLNRVRTAVNQAIPLMVTYRPTELTRLAELYLARSFAEMQLASDFCNGIPFSNAATPDGIVQFGDPLSVDSVFKLAIVSADSGIGLATATDTQTVNILNALRITKARALLGLNQIAAAGALTALVPTNFSYNHTFASASGTNAVWGQPFSGRRYLVGDSLDGNARNILVKNAIPFFSLKDPRVPADFTIAIKSGKPDTTKSQDGLTLSRTLGKSTTIATGTTVAAMYDQFTSVTVANGIDARLIDAEAALTAGAPATMITILNTLRATPFTIGTITTPVMAALVDPGTLIAEQDLLFREKALWSFSRGQRLGQMRRLIRYYGRLANTVFPEGTHYRGGTYGADVNLPVPQEEQNNPQFKGCTDRLP